MTDSELLEVCKVYEYLPFEKLLLLMWWELFNKNKLLAFYNNLRRGMHPMAAFDNVLKQEQWNVNKINISLVIINLVLLGV